MKRLPTSRSQRGYDRLARFYQPLEWLVYGDRLQSARTALIAELPPWDRLLVLGDGDGRLLERLVADQIHSLTRRDVVKGTGNGMGTGRDEVKQARDWKVTSVDQSTRMLRRQRSRTARLVGTDHIEFICADAVSFTPQKQAYDIIVTPFFLDCFGEAELDVLLPQWLSGLRPGGTLYHVDFIVPRQAWQRVRAQALLWTMHVFFRWQTGLENPSLVDTESAIERCGLRKAAEHISGSGMLASQIWRCRPVPLGTRPTSM